MERELAAPARILATPLTSLVARITIKPQGHASPRRHGPPWEEKMATSIRLFRGAFGHVSILNVASDLVTHAHSEAHIIVWLDGAAGEMMVGRASVRPGPGLAVAVNSFEPHSHSFPAGSEPGRFLAFYIDPEWVRRRRGLAAGAELFSAPSVPIDPWLQKAAENLLARHDDGMLAEEIAAYETERFIDSMLDAADAARPRRVRNGGRTMLDFRVRKAIALMQEHVADRISFDAVARAVGLSRPHFFALFKEQTNLTPNVYWNTLRMQEALRQLESEESVIVVAENLGFTTPGNFSRFFRDHAGVTPTLYREAAHAAA
jgi:AraC family transcriptional regulator